MKSIRWILASAACMTALGAAEAKPIRFTGFLMTDVSLGATMYKGAQVFLIFNADTGNSVPYSDQGAQGFKNMIGTASVRIVSGGRTIVARLNANQVFVYFDQVHASAGFGSYAGGYGYPLALASPPGDGWEPLSGTLVGAVASIAASPASATNYTPATATLSADLRSPTVLAGMASSCTASFVAANAICSPSAVPIALGTSMGPLLVYEPYTVTYPSGSSFVYAANWGMFWSEMVDE